MRRGVRRSQDHARPLRALAGDAQFRIQDCVCPVLRNAAAAASVLLPASYVNASRAETLRMVNAAPVQRETRSITRRRPNFGRTLRCDLRVNEYKNCRVEIAHAFIKCQRSILLINGKSPLNTQAQPADQLRI